MDAPAVTADIDRWLESDGANLSSLPGMAIRIMNRIDDSEAALAELTELVVREPVLGARLLRLVNSAYFALPHEVTSVRQAVHLLGYRTVAMTVLTAAVFSSFRSLSAGGFDLTRFWHHSVSAAAICRALGARYRSFDAETGFSAGLLHDIGKLVLVRYRPDDAGRVMAAARADSASFFDAEKRLLPATHADLGAWLLERWSVPAVLVHTVRTHHADAEGHLPPLTASVRFADYLCAVKGIRASGSHDEARLQKYTWKALGLNPSDIPPLIAAVDREIETAESLLQGA